MGNRAYDSDKIIKYIESKSAKAVIPARKNRKDNREYDKEVYKNRNKIKQYRRISTRYGKLVTSFLSFIQLASTLIALPKFSPIV